MSTIKADTLSTLDGTKSITTDRVTQGTAAAWVNFNGTGTVAIRASYNVSSITDNGTGDYTMNFTTAMPDANYAAVATSNQNAVGNPTNISVGYPDNDSAILYSTTQLRLLVKFSTSSAFDSPVVSVAIFR